MELGSDGASGSAKDVGDLARLVSEVVAKDEDRSLVRRQPSERSIQLIAVRHAEELVRRGWPIDRENAQIGDPTPLAACLRNADVREDAVHPGVESVRIAELRQVTPGDHQRVLQSILGPIDIPEDPVCNREQSIAARLDQVDERRLISSLGCLDEVAIHFHHRR